MAAKKPAAKKQNRSRSPRSGRSARAQTDAARLAPKKPAAKKPAAKKPAAKKPAAKKPAAKKPAASFAPAEHQLIENGMSQIWFACDEFDDRLDVVGAFEEAGLDPNGYGWEAVLAPALQRRDPAAFAAVEWSPEADTFVALAAEPGPLAVLAAVLREIVSDQDHLERAVAEHDPERG